MSELSGVVTGPLSHRNLLDGGNLLSDNRREHRAGFLGPRSKMSPPGVMVDKREGAPVENCSKGM